LLQDGDVGVGVGVFPEREEIFVGGERPDAGGIGIRSLLGSRSANAFHEIGSELLIRSVAKEVSMALEHRIQFCSAEKLLHAFVHLDEFQPAMLPLGGQVQADDRTKASTVHVAHVGQVQHDTFSLRD
jgi:hypothetical protein